MYLVPFPITAVEQYTCLALIVDEYYVMND